MLKLLTVIAVLVAGMSTQAHAQLTCKQTLKYVSVLAKVQKSGDKEQLRRVFLFFFTYTEAPSIITKEAAKDFRKDPAGAVDKLIVYLKSGRCEEDV